MLLFHKIKLREINEPYKLVGPSIHIAKKHEFQIDGTDLCLNFPKHKSSRHFPKPRDPKKLYRLDNYSFPSMIPSRPGWGSLLCGACAWDFYGRIFTGRIATITMTLTIISPAELKQGTSFFHPRSFEKTVGDYLLFRYEGEADLSDQSWYAPTEWEPFSIGRLQGARFRAISSNQANYSDRYLMLPISDSRLIALCFNMSWDNVNPSSPNRKEQHDISSLEQLCEDIMDTFEVKLSAESLAQQKEALMGLADSALVSKYPPLKLEK